MEWRFIVVVVMLLIKSVDRVGGSCSLSLKDFGNPSPVYIHNGGFLAPNTATGDVLLRRSETVQIACPGSRKFIVLSNVSTDLDVLDVKCVSNKTFRATKSPWVGVFKDIRCNSVPWFTAEKTNLTCDGGSVIYRVGYKVQAKFHTQYEACFEQNLLATRYVKHELTPASHFTPQGGRRPDFIETDVFGKVRMSKIYKLENQKERMRSLLGQSMDEKYISKKQFLSRGHLAARADYPMVFTQAATFHYINAAPQWQRGNAGDWAALEEAVRRRVSTYNSTVTVYTGTHGVCTLADSAAVQRELFLHVDDNNNGLVPVPLYYYKVVYDPRKKLATAFISINCPYYDDATLEKLSFCSDICEGNKQFSWLHWRANDATHSFCCEYRDFTGLVDSLPKLDVKGIFH